MCGGLDNLKKKFGRWVSAKVVPALFSRDNFSFDASFTFYCLGSLLFQNLAYR